MSDKMVLVPEGLLSYPTADGIDVQDVLDDMTDADWQSGSYVPQTATEYRNQIFQELIERAQESETRFAAWFVQDLKPVEGEDRGRREPIDQRPLADWLKSQMEGGE